MSERIKNNLEKIRTSAGKTREELAEELDTTSVTIWRWEAGERTLPIDSIPKIAKALGCYPCELLPKEWQKPTVSTNPEPIDEELLERMIVKILAECEKPEVKQELLKLGKEINPQFIAQMVAFNYKVRAEKKEDSVNLGETIKMAGTLLKMKSD